MPRIEHHKHTDLHHQDQLSLSGTCRTFENAPYSQEQSRQYSNHDIYVSHLEVRGDMLGMTLPSQDFQSGDLRRGALALQ